MALSVFSLPKILISLAPPLEPPVEPFSPVPSAPISDNEDGFRSALLSPPIQLSKHLSPLCPPEVPLKGSGLERERFEQLLKISRERAQALGNKRSPDLRKELAVKAHHTKQSERRARFLMKVQEPPSPTATNTPKTPPESPAMFHYALPSPGLESPLAMYEYLENECVTSKPWIEQVDYRLPFPAKASPKNVRAPASSRSSKKGLPSLAQISAHMTMKQLSDTHEAAAAPRRLPSFLQQKQQSAVVEEPVRKASPPPISVGRLRMPGTRSSSPPAPEVKRIYSAPPSPKTPELQVTITLVPRTASTTRNLTESNLEAFSRENMLRTLRRQSASTFEQDLAAQQKKVAEERLRRRHSAPPELPKRERAGFKHGVLNHRAGF